MFPISESSTIGDDSCVGYKNCFDMEDATIGDNSCNGDSIEGGDGYYGYVCAYAKGKCTAGMLTALSVSFSSLHCVLRSRNYWKQCML